jgi:ABC-type multidrug transport system fused ATPase/permease subunit
MNWIKNNEWLKPDTDNRIRWDQLRRFLANYRPFRGALAASAVMVLAGSLTAFVIPLVFRWIQAAIQARQARGLAAALVCFLAISVLEAVTGYGVRIIRSRISTKLNRELVLEYYRKILNLAVEDFIAFRQRTNLFQRLIDAMVITDQFTDALMRGGQGVITIVLTAVVIGMLSPAVLGVLAVGIAILFAYTLWQARDQRVLHQRTLALNYPLVGKMTEIIDGLFTIKALSASVRVTSDVLALVDGKMDAEYAELAAEVRSSQVTAGVRSAFLVLAVGAGCAMMMTGSLGLADVVSLYVLANLLLMPVAEMASRYHALSKLSVNIASYYEVIDLRDEAEEVRAAIDARRLHGGGGDAISGAGAAAEPRPGVKVFAVAGAERDGGVELARPAANGRNGSHAAAAVLEVPRVRPAETIGAGHITVSDLAFAYRGGETILSGVNLEIQPGERISLIGRSGVGKTTFIRLLLGFLQPQRGRIVVDGVDATALTDKNAYRRQFGVVSQHDVLFGVSLRENLTFGVQEEMPDERLEEAIRMVDLWDSVARFDRGLDTPYSDDLFSGGQRQRLFIARALLRRPSIVLLDEPTSALDFESERQVMSALDRLVGGKTTVTIAHRLSTVQNCDRVVLIDGGTVKATGTHLELYEANDYYRSLCEYNSFMV